MKTCCKSYNLELPRENLRHLDRRLCRLGPCVQEERLLQRSRQEARQTLRERYNGLCDHVAEKMVELRDILPDDLYDLGMRVP